MTVEEREQARGRFENKKKTKKLQNEKWDTIQNSSKEYHWNEGLCLCKRFRTRLYYKSIPALERAKREGLKTALIPLLM